MKAYLTQCLPVALLAFSLYAPLELGRLIISYSKNWGFYEAFAWELPLIGLGLVGQVWGLVLLVKRWKR